MTDYRMLTPPLAARRMLDFLANPSLGEVLSHPERWHIVRIVNGTLEVVRVQPEQEEQ